MPENQEAGALQAAIVLLLLASALFMVGWSVSGTAPDDLAEVPQLVHETFKSFVGAI